MHDKRWNLTGLAGCMIAVVAIACSASADSGLQDLIDRLGAGNQPTGADVVVGQVEAASNSNYLPDAADPGIADPDREWIEQSGPTGILGHATQVGKRFYGDLSVAPGIETIYNWSVNDWLNDGSLHVGDAGILPDITPGSIKVANHSWVGSFGGNPSNNDALRRADFVVTRDDIIVCAGASLPVVDGFPAMLGPMFNGIMVGLTSGEHTLGDVPDGLDGAGRMTPDMVADGNATSWSTPLVAGAAALLVETARSHPTRRGINSNAERSEVIKAALMAGAHREPDWTNNPADSGINRGITARPLDEVFGAGRLDVNISHLILTAGEQTGAISVPSETIIEHNGWDLVTLRSSRDAFYRFSIADTADTVTVLATWHRIVDASMDEWLLPDFNLQLWQVDALDNLVPLVGNFGLDVFESGSVVSESEIDNVEMLHVRGLEPGDYVIQLSRDDLLAELQSADAAIAWHIPESVCAGDSNGDGSVGLGDLLEVLSNWGTEGSAGGDVDGDNTVGLGDLLTVLSNWGNVC